MTPQNIELSAKLSVYIMSPDSVIFQGHAEALSSRNQKGRFDILPFHENFISIIQEFVIIHKNKREKKELLVKKGIIKVYENTVQIFIGIEA